MSKRRKIFSGQEVVSVLTQSLGFVFVSQKGSHVKLRSDARGATTIVPLHKELALGTFNNVLVLAKVDRRDFLRAASK